jgi:hypothetical protein
MIRDLDSGKLIPVKQLQPPSPHTPAAAGRPHVSLPVAAILQLP